MRKDIVLAVAVLSVLAGLLTVGYAQNQDDGLDALQLRRALIDRIEDAVTRGDAATLQGMAALPAPVPDAATVAQKLREVADNIERGIPPRQEILPGQGQVDPETGLTGVVSAFGVPWGEVLGGMVTCYWASKWGSEHCTETQTNCLNKTAGVTEGTTWGDYEHLAGVCNFGGQVCLDGVAADYSVCMANTLGSLW